MVNHITLQSEKNAAFIRQQAAELGFSFCGISEAGFLAEEAPRLERWLAQGRHGKMAYMENHFDKRLNPALLHEGAKSVVSLLLNYYPEKETGADEPGNEPKYKISKYAYGKDYHLVIKDKLKQLLARIRENIGEVSGRAFTDSAPVLEKAWAAKSGLGWVGKNGNLLNRSMGSFFFIAELIIDLELPPDGPVKDYCGTCTACIDACPTDAIIAPQVVDGSRCISYFTIELKDAIPASVKGKFENWIFGCDICQDVCPWNRFAKPHNEPEFLPSAELAGMKNKDWEEITEEVFGRVFGKSAAKRTGLAGLKRNVAFVKEADNLDNAPDTL
ncbi:MAG: tRNA epoxyqueuosine(34) reductase QueG [Bacteroidota bacterium]